MDDKITFEKFRSNNINKLGESNELKELSNDFILKSAKKGYSYNFDWCGLPIIQYPQDVVAMQELIWKIKPDLIIETGIARGGSLIFYASMLELLDEGHVLGIDIDIRDHNRQAIETHKFAKRISMIEGSSVSENVIEQVKEFAKKHKNSLVILDSMHTEEHVLKELELYSKFISLGSYIVVMDTIIEDMPKDYFHDKPWDVGDNPKTAVHKFLEQNKNFEIDKSIQDKLLITVAPDGFLKRIQ